MPKNKRGGKKAKRGKNQSDAPVKELILREDGQEYAKVIKMLGSCRVSALCNDGKQRQCLIRGKMRKKVWIKKDDIILIGLRDFQDGKADVIGKYSDEEARRLEKMGELCTMKPREEDDGIVNDEDELGFDFEEI
jgi:translation initiation factor 1A